MKKFSIILFATVISIAAFSQNENDALRYSLINYNGTARFSGLSGAYGAVGADFSSLSQNPAGIGLFRRSEFTITPMFDGAKTESSFAGSSNNEMRNAIYLGNIGYVWAIKLKDKNNNGLKQLQFGFGVNRTSLFNNRMVISGFNNENSLLTSYINQANASGTGLADLDNFGAGLAYDVNLIYVNDATGKYAIDMPNGGVQQTKTIETKGSMSETVLSMGGNFNDKLYVGATVGFPDIRYEEQSTYTEEDLNNLNPYFKSFKRTENLKTTGSGVNLKFGFIYSPISFLRIGGALHTPTNYYSMTDKWNTTMVAVYDQDPTKSKDSPDGSYDYKLYTPMKAIGSIAFILGQFGLISADYEYVDYSTAHLSAKDYNFLDENNNVKSKLTSATNIRLGAELKTGIYAIRGGYNLYGSPYKNEGSLGLGSRQGYSLGFGMHEKGYFLDFAFTHTTADDNYYFYDIAPASKNTYITNNYSLTVGVKF